ncbi:MAG: HAMP domain-containing sensor histidine kinase [Bacillota bacterium]
MNPNTPQTKQKKGGASLTWRLTGNQFLRSAMHTFFLDVLLVLLFVLSLAIWTEWQAMELSPKLLKRPGIGTELLLTDWEYRYELGEPQGIRLPTFLEKELLRRNPSIPPGTTRELRFPSGEDLLSRLKSAAYTLAIPSPESGRLLLVTYHWDIPVRIFFGCFVALLLVQVISLLRSISTVSRSVSRTLQPIYELTRTAARTIGNEQSRQRMDSPSLDGTIRTLNTITENRLDTRIVIADEHQELKGLADAINEMLDRLDAAYQSQLRFVSDASHELRTPIAVIQGYANMLDRWGKQDEQTLQESIDAIKSEAAGMQDLVEQLLFLARSDNDSIILKTGLVDVSSLAEEVLSETRMIDEAHAYESSIVPALTVYGDAQLIKQALRIFVDNAIKYTPAGERIHIAAKRDGGNVALSVSDNGIGIPEQDLAHVFDRFFRSDQSRARKTGGTGLGLSIAKWIVDRHGGHVELLSRKEIGTRIVLVLPYCSEAAGASL